MHLFVHPSQSIFNVQNGLKNISFHSISFVSLDHIYLTVNSLNISILMLVSHKKSCYPWSWLHSEQGPETHYSYINHLKVTF